MEPCYDSSFVLQRGSSYGACLVDGRVAPGEIFFAKSKRKTGG
jgi:hypothetical protein